MVFIETLYENVYIFKQCMLQYLELHDYSLLLNGSTTKQVRKISERGCSFLLSLEESVQGSVNTKGIKSH